ncbi:unnamed protein product, partial [Boreogadus saida]
VKQPEASFSGQLLISPISPSTHLLLEPPTFLSSNCHSEEIGQLQSFSRFHCFDQRADQRILRPEDIGLMYPESNMESPACFSSKQHASPGIYSARYGSPRKQLQFYRVGGDRRRQQHFLCGLGFLALVRDSAEVEEDVDKVMWLEVM